VTKANTNSQNLFDFSSYTLTIPNFIFLEAPIGYGKTFFIKELCENTLKEAKVISYSSKSKTSFKSFLAELFQKEFSNIYEYYKVLETSKEKIVFIFDDFHLLKQDDEVIEFITFFLKNQFENLYFILASREKINLPYENIIASNRALYINQTKLKINLDDLETPLTEEDKLFLAKFDGWALGIFLYLKHKNNELDFKAFQQLVESSINEFINETPLLTSKKAFSLIYELPKFWQEIVFKNFITKSSYWFLSIRAKSSISLSSTRVFKKSF
jgi:ATP/maltotriose-dependent transcriptional regulator MalT